VGEPSCNAPDICEAAFVAAMPRVVLSMLVLASSKIAHWTRFVEPNLVEMLYKDAIKSAVRYDTNPCTKN
jgi:hypothetical protein